MIRQSLVVNTVAASQNCLLVASDVPGKAYAGGEVVAVEAIPQRAIGHARRTCEAGEINLFRELERIQSLRSEGRIENARAIQLILTKTHAFPTETEVEGKSL